MRFDEVPCPIDDGKERYGRPWRQGERVFNHDLNPSGHGIPNEERCGPGLTLNLITKRIDCKRTPDKRFFCLLDTEESPPEYEGSYEYKKSRFHSAHVDRIEINNEDGEERPEWTTITRGPDGASIIPHAGALPVGEDRGVERFLRCEMGHAMDLGGKKPTYLPRGGYLHHDHFLLRCTENTSDVGFGSMMDTLKEAIQSARDESVRRKMGPTVDVGGGLRSRLR